MKRIIKKSIPYIAFFMVFSILVFADGFGPEPVWVNGNVNRAGVEITATNLNTGLSNSFTTMPNGDYLIGLYKTDIDVKKGHRVKLEVCGNIKTITVYAQSSVVDFDFGDNANPCGETGTEVIEPTPVTPIEPTPVVPEPIPLEPEPTAPVDPITPVVEQRTDYESVGIVFGILAILGIIYFTIKSLITRFTYRFKKKK